LNRTLVHTALLTIVLVVMWFLLSGFGLKQPIVTFGMLGVAFAVYMSIRMNVLDGESAPFAGLFKFLGYWSWLGGEIFKANVEVVRLALAPDLNIKPVMTRAAVNCETDLARATFANSITLTPGTVTVEVEDTGFLIHALDESFADQAAFEDIQKRVAKATGESV
jgi:multicomponent Na+:H+ antiporter subunit E